MSSAALPRARPRLLSRFQCSRTGHRWERQILDSGAEARWVCTSCGRLGDPIPVITADQEVVEVSEESNIAEPAAEDVPAGAPAAADVEPQEAEAAEPAAEEAPEVVSAGPSESSAGGILRRKPVLGVAVAGVAVAAAGIAVFALRRRRR